MSEFEKYPMLMAHPQYRAATVTPIEGTGVLNNEGIEVRQDMQGTPERYPPVQVNNEDQEAYHAAMGYRPAGKSDPAAYAQAVAETPVDRVIDEFPKWVGDVLVNSAEEEAALPRQHPDVQALVARLEAAKPPAFVSPGDVEDVDVYALLAELAALKAELGKTDDDFPKEIGPPPFVTPGDVEALRKEYKARFGKRPYNGWKAEVLLQKLAA